MNPVARRVHLCRRDDLVGDLQRFHVDGRPIVLVRLDDGLVALDDTCSHENASLAEEGELDAGAREVECCRHGARFSLDDGCATSLPATVGLGVYPVVTDGDDVYVETTS